MARITGRSAGRELVRRPASTIAIASALVVTLATAAWAVSNYTWSANKLVGGASQAATFMNGVHQLAVTVDKSVTPAKTYANFVYQSDYTTAGVYTNDTKCAASNDCLANYYVRSSDGGKTWNNPKRLPAPANTHMDRGTIATTGTTIVALEMSQTKYYQSGSTFDVSAPRYVYATRSTDNGATWSNAVQLPGQTTTSRGDYLNVWASGSYVHAVVTNTQTGAIWYWRSIDKGQTWANPVSIGSTTATDTDPNGYVGGFSGLPSIAASGSTVIASWIDNPSGRVVYARSTNNGGAWGAETQLLASGGLDNLGYVNMDARDTRIGVSWTTAAGGWVKIYSTGTSSFGPDRQFVSFPDSGVGSLDNKGGEGAMVALGPGNLVGITLSECNQLSTGEICSANLSNNKTREQLVWRASDDNGATWSNPDVIGPVGQAKTTFINNYGDVIYVKSKPLAVWNGHDAVYFNYVNFRTVGTPA
jgi:hypothetical protein